MNISNKYVDECKDPKSKQYRDKSRAVQLKLKVGSLIKGKIMI
jgi:hypothetical protein